MAAREPSAAGLEKGQRNPTIIPLCGLAKTLGDRTRLAHRQIIGRICTAAILSDQSEGTRHHSFAAVPGRPDDTGDRGRQPELALGATSRAALPLHPGTLPLDALRNNSLIAESHSLFG